MIGHPQVQASETVIEHEHHAAGRLRQARPAARFEGTPVGIRRGAPLLGEHSREILHEVGFSGADIDRFHDTGVVTSYEPG